MKEIFFLGSVLQQDLYKQPGNFLDVKKALAFEHIGSDKVSGFARPTSMRDGHGGYLSG
jgi:hypothetical protein